MATTEPHEYKQLTSDYLFNLLSNLPEGTQADHELIKRSCCRWLLRAPAELYFRNADGIEDKEYVSIRDISLTGVGVLCKKPLPTGAQAELVLPLEDGYYKIDATVAHCTGTIGGYKVGCHLILPGVPVMVPMISRAMLTQDEYERNAR